MNSGEMLPVLCGLVLGSILGVVRSSLRRRVGLAAVLLLGYLVSAASGELQAGWSYILLDATLVMISALAGHFVSHCLRSRPAGT